MSSSFSSSKNQSTCLLSSIHHFGESLLQEILCILYYSSFLFLPSLLLSQSFVWDNLSRIYPSESWTVFSRGSMWKAHDYFNYFIISSCCTQVVWMRLEVFNPIQVLAEQEKTIFQISKCAYTVCQYCTAFSQLQSKSTKHCDQTLSG